MPIHCSLSRRIHQPRRGKHIHRCRVHGWRVAAGHCGHGGMRQRERPRKHILPSPARASIRPRKASGASRHQAEQPAHQSFGSCQGQRLWHRQGNGRCLHGKHICRDSQLHEPRENRGKQLRLSFRHMVLWPHHSHGRTRKVPLQHRRGLLGTPAQPAR